VYGDEIEKHIQLVVTWSKIYDQQKCCTRLILNAKSGLLLNKRLVGSVCIITAHPSSRSIAFKNSFRSFLGPFFFLKKSQKYIASYRIIFFQETDWFYKR
jgi:hypothetical protein